MVLKLYDINAEVYVLVMLPNVGNDVSEGNLNVKCY